MTKPPTYLATTLALCERVEAHDRAMTAKPWCEHRYAAEVLDDDDEAVARCDIPGDRLTGGTAQQHADAAGIASYRTDAPALAARVRVFAELLPALEALFTVAVRDDIWPKFHAADTAYLDALAKLEGMP